MSAASCTAERLFNTRRRTLTWLRSTMGQDRLQELSVISIETFNERDISNKVLEEDMELLINKFASVGGRRDYFF